VTGVGQRLEAQIPTNREFLGCNI